MLRRVDLVMVIVLGLAGCATAQSERAAERLPSRGQAVDVELVGFAFRPNVIEVTSGLPLRLAAQNTDSLDHNITILSQGNEPLKRVDVPAGETVMSGITFPASGRYVFYCDKFMDRTFGMEGTAVAR